MRAKESFVIDEVHRQTGKSGIVYAGSRDKTSEIAKLLIDAGVRAHHYHAGLSHEVRTSVQRQFMNDEIDVIVATNAFGMGIDKPDVRYVIHFDVPQRLESYYQEAGRAGRDGEYSECTLLIGNRAWQGPQRFITSAHPKPEEVIRIWDDLVHGGGPEGLISRDALKLVPPIVQLSFQGQGLLDISASRLLGFEHDIRLDQSLVRNHERRDQDMLSHMKAYVYGEGCRAAAITEYFGHASSVQCGMCDSCEHMTEREIETFARLHKVRSEVAEKLEVTPMRVLDQQTIWNLIRRWPISREELIAIPGIGSSRIGWVGQQILDLFSRTNRKDLDPQPTRLSTSDLSDFSHEQLHAILIAWRADKRSQLGVPTYVIFNDATLQQIAALKPADAGQLMQVKGVGPHKLERYGEEILALVAGAQPKKEFAESTNEWVAVDQFDQALLEDLKDWRLKTSKELGQPAFLILHDRSLESMSASLPKTNEELLAIVGVGPAKVTKYGQDVLRIVRAHSGTQPLRKGKLSESHNISPAKDVELTVGCESELREWRRVTAANLGIPAFRIFTDRTLRNLSQARPLDKDELVAINGIGKWTLDQYGNAILRAVRNFLKVGAQ